MHSLATLEEPSILQGEGQDQYKQGTGFVRGERKLSLIVPYRQEGKIQRGALIVLIKGCIVLKMQSSQVRKQTRA